MRHWINPWPEALDTTIDEIIAHHISVVAPPSPEMYKKDLETIIFQHKNGLDAYILPGPSGHHNLGIRYGNKLQEYMSFTTKWGSPELENILMRAKARILTSTILIP